MFVLCPVVCLELVEATGDEGVFEQLKDGRQLHSVSDDAMADGHPKGKKKRAYRDFLHFRPLDNAFTAFHTPLPFLSQEHGWSYSNVGDGEGKSQYSIFSLLQGTTHHSRRDP